MQPISSDSNNTSLPDKVAAPSQNDKKKQDADLTFGVFKWRTQWIMVDVRVLKSWMPDLLEKIQNFPEWDRKFSAIDPKDAKETSDNTNKFPNKLSTTDKVAREELNLSTQTLCERDLTELEPENLHMISNKNGVCRIIPFRKLMDSRKKLMDSRKICPPVKAFLSTENPPNIMAKAFVNIFTYHTNTMHRYKLVGAIDYNSTSSAALEQRFILSYKLEVPRPVFQSLWRSIGQRYQERQKARQLAKQQATPRPSLEKSSQNLIGEAVTPSTAKSRSKPNDNRTA